MVKPCGKSDRMGKPGLSRELPQTTLEAMTRPTGLAGGPTLAAAILKGQVQGRLVVDPDG